MSIYKDLPPLGPSDIRLLKIPCKNATSARGFECSLIVTPLSDAPGYSALSYAWGDSPLVNGVRCNEYHLSIKPNLLSALTSIQDLQSVGEYHHLWIDAICINQSDLQERSAQVSIMKEIYHNAQLVYVWLGGHTSDLGRAIVLIQKLNTAAVLRVDEPDLNTAEIAKRAKLPPVGSNDAWNDLSNLFFNRPWFTRVWTIQELCHARQCLVLNGRTTVGWDELANIAPLFSDYQYSIPGRWKVNALWHFNRIKSDYSSNQPRSLLDLLQSFRRQQASDLRDKVYAVLNLSTSRAVSLLPIDYTITASEVYENAAKSMILADAPEGRNLDVLCAVHPLQTPGWPSWVPVWSQPLNTLAIFNGDRSRIYYAAKDSVATVSICPNPQRLIVTGFRLDVVEIAALPMKLSPGHIPVNSIRSNPAAQTILADWILLALKMGTYPTNECLDDALCETLVAGKGFNDIFPISDDEYDEFYKRYVDLRTQVLRLVKSGNLYKTRSQEHYINLDFEEPSTYIAKIEIISYFRRLIITQNGYIGLTPYTAEPDDMIAIFLGAQTPFVLRRQEGEWALLGECYIHGMMHGEAFDKPNIKYEDFRLR